MSSSKIIYNSTKEEYKFTIENQLEAYRRIKKWNVDLARVDLIAVTGVLAGISLTNFEMNILFIGFIISLSYALWCCSKIHHHQPLGRGVGHQFIKEVDELVDKNIDEEKYYRQLSVSYALSVKIFTKKFEDTVNTYHNALWSSVCALIFLIIYISSIAVPLKYPSTAEIPFLFIIPIIAMWGKNKSDENIDEI
jgi:hypothetical protein